MRPRLFVELPGGVGKLHLLARSNIPSLRRVSAIHPMRNCPKDLQCIMARICWDGRLNQSACHDASRRLERFSPRSHATSKARRCSGAAQTCGFSMLDRHLRPPSGDPEARSRCHRIREALRTSIESRAKQGQHQTQSPSDIGRQHSNIKTGRQTRASKGLSLIADLMLILQSNVRPPRRH